VADAAARGVGAARAAAVNPGAGGNPGAAVRAEVSPAADNRNG